MVTKKTRHSNNQQSAIKSHLSVSDSCRKLCREDVFSVLARGRSVLHLSVLEALYIRKLSPELCVQKDNVLSLQLFGANPHESVRSASPLRFSVCFSHSHSFTFTLCWTCLPVLLNLILFPHV